MRLPLAAVLALTLTAPALPGVDPWMMPGCNLDGLPCHADPGERIVDEQHGLVVVATAGHGPDAAPDLTVEAIPSDRGPAAGDCPPPEAMSVRLELAYPSC